MRRLLLLALAAALASAGWFAFAGGGSTLVQATHGIFNAHVHDDYFHPTGSFSPGPGHATAQALCMGATPDPSCTAVIHAGDSVQWVAPAPLAANFHSVTECTDGTWSVCGAGASSPNPIEDSGVLAQPGWPYVVAFNNSGVFYYRCEVHPTTMRGVVIVTAPAGAVGGTVEQLTEDSGPAAVTADGGDLSLNYALAAAALGMVALGGLGLIAHRRLAGRRTD